MFCRSAYSRPHRRRKDLVLLERKGGNTQCHFARSTHNNHAARQEIDSHFMTNVLLQLPQSSVIVAVSNSLL